LRILIGFLAAIVVVASAGAQTPPVSEPPPAIAFEDWRVVREEEDSTEYLVQFPTALPTSSPENNTVPMRVLIPEPRNGPLPVVIVLHYWGAHDLRVELALAQELLSRGIAVALPALPYHLGRTPSGYRSGELAIRADPEHLVHMTKQSVFDVRRALDFLQFRPEFHKNQIGVAGTSLGAVVASLTYAVDSRFTHGAFMLGGVDLAHILWHGSRVVLERDQLRRQGYTESRLREALEEIEPMGLLPGEPGRSSFVVGARFDTVVPPEDTVKLINALDNPKVLWLETGHYGGVFVQRRVLRTVASYFEREFGGGEYSPPSSLSAPTFRVGLGANPGTGLQLAAGIDIWRNNARGDLFSSLLATPRGPQLFLGARLDRGIAIGGFATPRRIFPGVFWSTVL
jgi:hypothetical protein